MSKGNKDLTQTKASTMDFRIKIFLCLLILTPSNIQLVHGMPKEPIFFQKLITDPHRFDDFLVSNANIGRADVQACISVIPSYTGSPTTSTPTPSAEPVTTPPPIPEDATTSTVTPSPSGRFRARAIEDGEREATTDDDIVTSGVEETAQWVVGDCANNYEVQDVIYGATTAKKYLILKISGIYEFTWPFIHKLVKNKRFILLQWPIVVGPASEANFDIHVPSEVEGLHKVVLTFLEGTTMQDNEDDRYWYYHYEQMGAVMNMPPINTIPVKLIAFNGLYLTRSTAPDLANCSFATGFLHYLNDKDTVRLNPRAYKRRIQAYNMINRYNIWGISEFISPDFSSGRKNGGYTGVMVIVVAWVSWMGL